VNKIDEIEGKLRRLVEQYQTLRQENDKLRSDNEATRSTLELLTNENQKAQQILTDYQHIRKRQEQAAAKVNKALQTLNSLRT